MSKYTTTIEVIINSQSNHEENIYDRIKTGKKFIFDFPYQYPNDDFKENFEMQFCEKFWQESIGFETVPLFKMKLKQKLEMVMPEICFKYSALEKLINADPTIERSGKSEEKTVNSSETISKAETSNNGTTDGNTKNLSSDLPADLINADDIKDITYASNGGFNQSSNSSSANGKAESSNTTASTNTIEKIYEEHGSNLENYSKYFLSYHNLIAELLKDLDSLFIQLLF